MGGDDFRRQKAGLAGPRLLEKTTLPLEIKHLAKRANWYAGCNAAGATKRERKQRNA
jgi:hypothetical protein